MPLVMFRNLFVAGVFAILVSGCSLFYDENKPEVTQGQYCNVFDVIKKIPYNIKGIASIELKNNLWMLKTVNVSDDIANQAIRATYKFVITQYAFNPETEKIEQIGEKTYSNDEYLPPSFTSLVSAVESVKKSVGNSRIFSVRFYNGSWSIDAGVILSSEKIKDNSKKQIVRYTINPVNSVVTKSEILR